MHSEIGEALFRATDVFALREEQVTAMKLATGAPCAGHGAMFAPWPGPETDVERWYLLESGRAVGVSGAESAAPRLHLCEASSEATPAVRDRPNLRAAHGRDAV